MSLRQFPLRASLVALAVLLVSVSLPQPAAAKDAPDAPSTPPKPPAPAAVPASRSPWIGIAMDNGGDMGVRVEHVIRGAPAERAGVRANDRIVKLDGAPITSPEQVSRAVTAKKVGDNVTLGVERGGALLDVVVALAGRPASDEMVKMNLVGAPAPPWSATPMTGAPASVAALKGKVAIIDFWASWCGPCKYIAPRLGALRDRYGAQGLAVIGITTDEAEHAARAVEKIPIRYPSVIDDNGATSRAYGISSLPTLVIVDKAGVVRGVFVGFDPGGDPGLEAMVKKLLAEPMPKT